MRRLMLGLVLLAAAGAGCEHPNEPDESGELRAGVDARGDVRDLRRPSPPPDPDAVLQPMPGPRTSTPGGVAAGLH